MTEVALSLLSDKYPSHHDGWIQQQRDLTSELQAKGLVKEGDSVEKDDKGVASEIILALGTSGAVHAAVECFRIWLRPKSRRQVILTRTKDKKTLVLTETDTHSEANLSAIIKSFMNN